MKSEICQAISLPYNWFCPGNVPVFSHQISKLSATYQFLVIKSQTCQNLPVFSRQISKLSATYQSLVTKPQTYQATVKFAHRFHCILPMATWDLCRTSYLPVYQPCWIRCHALTWMICEWVCVSLHSVCTKASATGTYPWPFHITKASATGTCNKWNYPLPLHITKASATGTCNLWTYPLPLHITKASATGTCCTELAPLR